MVHESGIRRKGKVKANFWLTKDEKSLLAEAAAREGVTMSDMIRILLIRNAKKEGLMK